jgi:hypothetical protein
MNDPPKMDFVKLISPDSTMRELNMDSIQNSIQKQASRNPLETSHKKFNSVQFCENMK